MFVIIVPLHQLWDLIYPFWSSKKSRKNEMNMQHGAWNMDSGKVPWYQFRCEFRWRSSHFSYVFLFVSIYSLQFAVMFGIQFHPFILLHSTFIGFSTYNIKCNIIFPFFAFNFRDAFLFVSFFFSFFVSELFFLIFHFRLDFSFLNFISIFSLVASHCQSM